MIDRVRSVLFRLGRDRNANVRRVSLELVALSDGAMAERLADLLESGQMHLLGG